MKLRKSARIGSNFLHVHVHVHIHLISARIKLVVFSEPIFGKSISMVMVITEIANFHNLITCMLYFLHGIRHVHTLYIYFFVGLAVNQQYYVQQQPEEEYDVVCCTIL